MTGYEYDVVPTGNALQYLATALQPWSVFKTMTLADTTFIVNTERVVKMDAELSPGALTGSVQTFTDLPKPTGSVPVPMGVIYEIVGASGNEFDNYYVQRAGVQAAHGHFADCAQHLVYRIEFRGENGRECHECP